MSSPSIAEPTNAEKIRLLPWSIASNAANTVFVHYTFFGSAFVLFLNELQLNNAQIGLLLSFFPFFGLIAIFIAPRVARFGYKRTFITFFGIRKFITALLLLTPWLLRWGGPQLTLYFVMLIVILFALCRSIADTAWIPWAQEYVPNAIRGKYSATNSIVSNLTGVVATSIAGAIIGASLGLGRFMVLIGIGVVAGLISVWAGSFRPGGLPMEPSAGASLSLAGLRSSWGDRNLRNFLIGFGLITLATVPMYSFIPVFMENVIGLNSGEVVWLQTATLIGGLASTYLWGWAVDRYGGKPVMVTGLVARLLLPLGWLWLPLTGRFSLPLALAIAGLQGATDIGWVLGSSRLLYVSIVPPEKRVEYTALYSAAVGLFGGVSQLLGGRLLDLFAGLQGELLFFPLNPHVPLFLFGLFVPLISLVLFRRVDADSRFSFSEFAGLFIHGNPFLALTTLPRYYWAKDEARAVEITARLGQTQSHLTVEELLDALVDPRFNVRFEAVIAIARMRPDPRLITALRKIMEGTELSLAVVAAWALGRIGDEHALKTLRDGLDSNYRSIRAHSARALGALGAQQVGPMLLARLDKEEDKGLQMAYASALGHLQMRAATGRLLALLQATANPGARLELALSLARIIGDEPNFINLLRRFRADPGTTSSQELRGLAGKVPSTWPDAALIEQTLRRSSTAFAEERLRDGAALVHEALIKQPQTGAARETQLIQETCLEHLASYDSEHPEYLLLLLHSLRAGW